MIPKKKKFLVILLVLAIFIGIILNQTLFKKEFLYAGTIEALKVDIPARVSSVIEKIHVRNGQQVASGTLLLQMTCEEIRLENRWVTEQFHRTSRLFRMGSLSQEIFDREKNQKSLSDLKLSWCDVKAPLNGTVLTRYYEPGELVGMNTKLLTMADLSRVYAYIYIAQPEVAHVKLGQKVTGLLPELDDKKYEGVITEVGEQAEFTPKNVQTRSERQRLVYAVKVEFENPEQILKPGMTLEVRLPPPP